MDRRPFLPLAALALLATPLAAQTVPTITLSRPEAQFADPYDQVTAVRELGDGRVIVADLFARTVSLADFRSGSATAIGREGQGPGEFAFPNGLVPLAGDSTLLVDPGQRRFLRIGPDGKPAGIVSFPEGLGGPMNVKGADRQGRIYFQGSPFGGGPLGGPGNDDGRIPDSVAVLRWDRARRKVDTLGQVKIQSIARAASGNARSRAVVMRMQPFSPTDDWGVTPDGRVGVARVGDYHVEWLGAAPVVGRPVPYARVPVSKADKDAYARRAQDQRGRFAVTDGGPGPRSGGGAPPSAPKLPDPEWPEFKPPFASNGVLASPDGRLWVQRSQPANAAALYDVFDGAGRLVKQVRLAPNSRVVGFGASSVYVAYTDDDELQHLQRFRRP